MSDAIVYRYDPALFAGGYLQIPGTSQFSGVEATATWALEDGISLEGFVSDLSAEDADGNGLPYRPETTAQITARFSDDKSEWLLLARYTSDRQDGFGTTLDDYTVVDGSFRYAVSESVKVSLRAENLTNEGYSDIVGYRSAGRSMYLGLNISI